MDEGEREVEAALHPSRVAGDLAVGGLDEPDAVQELLRTRLPLGLGDALQRGLQPQMVAGREERVERRLLQGDPDDAGGRQRAVLGRKRPNGPGRWAARSCCRTPQIGMISL